MAISGVRHSDVRLRPRTLSVIVHTGAATISWWPSPARGRHLPLEQRPAHGADRRPPGRSRLPTPAGAPVGAVGAQAPALLPGTGARGSQCRAEYLPEGGRGPSAQKLSRRLGAGPLRGDELRPPLRSFAPSPPPRPRRHPRRGIRTAANRWGPVPTGLGTDARGSCRDRSSKFAAACCAGSPATACSIPMMPATGSPGPIAVSHSTLACASPGTTRQDWNGG